MNSTATVQAAVREATQIEEALQGTQGSLDTMGILMCQLDERLVSVLRKEPDPLKTEKVNEDLVPLAEEIRTIQKRVDSCVDRLQSWLRRIEIAG